MTKCVMCDAEAVCQCSGGLGIWGCYAPLCAEHKDQHHPDDAAWQEWLQTDQGRDLHEKAGGLGGSIGPGSAGLWYAFMAGYSRGYRNGRPDKA